MAKTGTSWVKGQSGNPKGRASVDNTKVNVLTELCNADTAKVYARMMELIFNDSTPSSTQAVLLKFHLEQGHGKALQAIRIEADEKLDNVDPVQMTTEQLNMLVIGKAMEFLASLYEGGKLQQVYQQLEAGWRPAGWEPKAKNVGSNTAH